MNRIGPALLMMFGGALLTLCAFVGGGVVPDLIPDVGPKPLGGTRVLLIRETSPQDEDYSAEAQEIFRSDKYFAGYSQRGLSFLPYDDDASELGAELSRRAREFSGPVLAIEDDSAAVVWIGPMPYPIESFDAKVKEITGR